MKVSVHTLSVGQAAVLALERAEPCVRAHVPHVGVFMGKNSKANRALDLAASGSFLGSLPGGVLPDLRELVQLLLLRKILLDLFFVRRYHLICVKASSKCDNCKYPPNILLENCCFVKIMALLKVQSLIHS